METRKNELDTFLQSIVEMIHPENNVDMSNFLNYDIEIGSQKHKFNWQPKHSEKSEASEELKIKMSSLERENVLLRSQKKVLAQLLYKHL